MIKRIPDSVMFLISINFAGMGASEICEKYIGKPFSSNYMMSIGAEFAKKIMRIRNKSINFQIWDLAGHPSKRTVRSVYYYGKLGFFIFFKKNNRQSFDDVRLWFEEFKLHTGLPINQYSKEQLVLLGIIEEVEEVSKEEGVKLAEELGMSYYELSSECNEILDTIFHKLGEKYLDSAGIK